MDTLAGHPEPGRHLHNRQPVPDWRRLGARNWAIGTPDAEMAECVLGEEPTQRRRLFAKLCFDAVGRYGYMGKLSVQLEPKEQLVQWAALYGG